MKTLLLGLVWFVGTGVLRAAGPDTPATASGDTVWMTWRAASGEEKAFTFTGTAGADFVVEWGDGAQGRYRGLGDGEGVTARHTYVNAKQYEVCFYGLPEAEKPVLADSGYVETAFGMEMHMVYVKGGTFTMGCTAEQGGDCEPDESPSHSVTLDDYYIGQFELTQGQWEAVMGTKPSSFQNGDDYPVESVSWNDAVAFCEKLSERTGKTYRLPTEAEWEYAARGGQYNDGTKYAGSDDIGDVAWYMDNSYNLGPTHPDYGMHPVGQKKPNGLGLYDMSGNVWEWCYDWYGAYSESPADNPQGPSSGTNRVLRGGGWKIRAQYCRVLLRYFEFQSYRGDYLGFRVVCER